MSLSKPRLISKLSLETEGVSPFALSHSLDYALEQTFKALKADLRANPGKTYMIVVVEEEAND